MILTRSSMLAQGSCTPGKVIQSCSSAARMTTENSFKSSVTRWSLRSRSQYLLFTYFSTNDCHHSLEKLPRKYPSSVRKICAKFLSGVKFGLGFALERSCGTNCHSCTGSPFHRQCRFFDFKPHYLVRLEKKPGTPDLNVSIILATFVEFILHVI